MASEALDAVLALVDAGGWIAGVLVAMCGAMWFVAAFRGLTLRRGFRGPLHQLVASCIGADTCARTHDDPHAGVVVRFVHHASLTLRRPDACNHDLDRWASHELDRTESFAALLHSLVAAAPLLGLLGTVSGMIETFASMHGAHHGGHATDATIAGGISVALITTQMGLVIGIPGLVVARLLDRVALARRREIQAARVLLAETFSRGEP